MSVGFGGSSQLFLHLEQLRRLAMRANLSVGVEKGDTGNLLQIRVDPAEWGQIFILDFGLESGIKSTERK